MTGHSTERRDAEGAWEATDMEAVVGIAAAAERGFIDADDKASFFLCDVDVARVLPEKLAVVFGDDFAARGIE